MIDCLLIGVNERDIEQYIEAVGSRGINSGEYRELRLSYIRLNGKAHRALDVLSYFNFRDTSRYKPLHNLDFLWPAISYLGNYLNKHNLTFDYVNNFHFEKDILREKLKSNNILTIGISTSLYVSPLPILDIITFIKKYNSKAKIVVGGPYIYNQMLSLSSYDFQLLLMYIGADYFVISQEGENAFVRLLHSLKQNKSIDCINNLAIKKEDSYRITNIEREVNPIEESTIDYNLFSDKELGEMVFLRTSKSCPFCCSFCSFPQRAGKYSYLKTELVEQELIKLKDKGVKHLTFTDDTFNIPVKHFEEILLMMIKNRFDFKWCCHIRCNFLNDSIIKLMKEAGCEGVFLGIESGSNKILINMNKRTTKEDYLRAVPLLKRAGIITHANVIIGFPGETVATAQETIDLIRRLSPDFYMAQLWYCDPMTPIWKEKNKFGITGKGYRWAHNTMDHKLACNIIDSMLCSITDSVCIPQWGFAFWSIFYLLHKNMSISQLKNYLLTFNKCLAYKIKHDDKQDIPFQLIQELEKSALFEIKKEEIKETVENIVQKIKGMGIELGFVNSKLHLKAVKGTVTPEIKNMILANKQRIIDYLCNNNFDNFLRTSPKEYKTLNNAPLSFGQSRLWFLDQFSGERIAGSYNIPIVLRLKGKINVTAMASAINKLIARHESLRTLFKKHKDGQAYQFVLPLDHVDISLCVETVSESKAKSLIDEEIHRWFNLSEEMLIRLRLFKVKETREYLLTIVKHHIISDGWSLGIFVKELCELYNSEISGRKNSLPELPAQYRDYAVWQKEYITGEILNKNLAYWKNKLADYQSLDLPTDKPRPTIQTYSGARSSFLIGNELTCNLKELAANTDSTLYMILLSAFSILMNKYSGQDDIIVGSPIANRQLRQIENLIGFFVNTLVLRIKVKTQSIKELISQVKETTLEAYKYQELPFEYLVDALNVERDQSKSPIIQVVFALQNAADNINFKLNGVKIKDEPFKRKTSTFDLAFSLIERDDKLIVHIDYSTDLYYSETIEKMFRHFCNVLASITNNLESNVGEVQLLSKQELKTIICDWNKTEAFYQRDKTIHELFEHQVSKTPNEIAASFLTNKLTYRELNERANQLAFTIRKEFKEHWDQEVVRDTFIGIYINRSIEMIIGILGILKSGAAYVPFNSADPEARLRFKINDCGCKMILTSSTRSEDLIFLVENDTLPLAIDSYWDIIEKAPKENPKQINSSVDIAYVIYTSGSTGKPKGVMIEHQGICNLATYVRAKFKISVGLKVLQFAPICFDASVYEWIGALTSGAELVILEENELPPKTNLSYVLFHKQINIAMLPPSIINTMQKRDLPALFTIVSGAEVCPQEAVNSWGNNRLFINAYGPTEATVASSMLECDNDSTPNIGKPISNKKFYVLDGNMFPVPPKAKGELYIGGEGVARGYLNSSELTKERFVSNPFVSDKEKKEGRNLRLFKTGDLVRWLPDGNLEFLGRNDDQVKVRGFRIELGEIETILSTHPSIKQSVVTVSEHGFLRIENQTQIDKESGKYIVTYYTAKTKVSENELINYLAEFLPNYMIPTYFVLLEFIPTNIRGKIDRSLLPKPNVNEYTEKEYIAPRNEEEQIIHDIWCEVLGLKKISIKTDFFKTGGNSLSTITLSSLIEKKVLRDIPVIMIFQNTTIEKQAKEVAGLVAKPTSKLFYLKKSDNYDHTLVLFHAGFSGAESYYKLAQKLDSSTRVIALNNYYMNNFPNDGFHINDIIKHYLCYIEEEGLLLDNKPVSIGGWSFGGNLAVSMLSSFKKINTKNLFLFDAIHPNAEKTINAHVQEKLNDPDNFFFKRFKDAGYSREQIKKMITRVSQDLFLLKYSQHKLKTILFKSCQETMGTIINDPYNGWEKYLKNIEMVKLEDANHLDLLAKEESVNFIARKMNEVLRPQNS